MSVIGSLESLAGLAAFVTSVETGGFAAAGRKLGVSASAIGKAVRRLEKRLGVRLLQRTTRSISPTTEGELLYSRSVRILDDVREAEDAISKTRSAPRGRLKVSVPTVLGCRVLVPALPRFMADYPEIELELDFNDRLVDVVADGFDLVVRTGDVSSSRLIARKLGPHQFVTCGSPAYFTQRGVPQTPAALGEHSCLRFRFPSTGLLAEWEFRGNSEHPLLGPGLALNDGEALVAAALAGMGIAHLPVYYVSTHLKRGQLQEVLRGYEVARGHVWLVWPPGRKDAPKVRVFADFVRRLFK